MGRFLGLSFLCLGLLGGCSSMKWQDQLPDDVVLSSTQQVVLEDFESGTVKILGEQHSHPGQEGQVDYSFEKAYFLDDGVGVVITRLKFLEPICGLDKSVFVTDDVELCARHPKSTYELYARGIGGPNRAFGPNKEFALRDGYCFSQNEVLYRVSDVYREKCLIGRAVAHGVNRSAQASFYEVLHQYRMRPVIKRLVQACARAAVDSYGAGHYMNSQWQKYCGVIRAPSFGKGKVFKDKAQYKELGDYLESKILSNVR